MIARVGKVTNIYPSTGKVKVMYEDEKSASLPLSMLTMNQEYSMPAIGERVVTMHMENGSSKGFVLGTYYGGGMQPKANSGYRKDFGGAYAVCQGGAYMLSAGSLLLKGEDKAAVKGGSAGLTLDENAVLVGSEVMLGSAQAAESEETAKPESYLKITEDAAEVKAVSEIRIESETELRLKSVHVLAEAEEITLQCSYGTITVEELMKRLKRIEDQLGLPHTI